MMVQDSETQVEAALSKAWARNWDMVTFISLGSELSQSHIRFRRGVAWLSSLHEKSVKKFVAIFNLSQW